MKGAIKMYYKIKTSKTTYKIIKKEDVKNSLLAALLFAVFALSGFLN
jgi:hypothetical protein